MYRTRYGSFKWRGSDWWTLSRPLISCWYANIRCLLALSASLTLTNTPFVHHTQRVEARLQEALDLVQTCLEPTTKVALLHAIEAHMLAPHCQTLVDKGMTPLLTELVFPKQFSEPISQASKQDFPSIPSPTTVPMIHEPSSSSVAYKLGRADPSGLHQLQQNISPTPSSSSSFQHLKRMYALLDRVKLLHIVKAQWATFIKNTGWYTLRIYYKCMYILISLPIYTLYR